MKTLIIVFGILFAMNLMAEESCKVNESTVIKEATEDVNTEVPKELEDGEIIVRTKDGKERVLKSNEFKVVKRKQQFKVKERVIVQRVECEPQIVIQKANERKNLVSLGVRKDYISLDKSISGNSATIRKEEGLVFDLSYFRRDILDSRIGLGIGLDTNETLRGIIGLEF